MKKARKWKLIVGIPIFLSVFLLAFFTALNSDDFFEIDIYKSLLNFEQYYMIYNELDSILSVVEHLNLDSNTGL